MMRFKVFSIPLILAILCTAGCHVQDPDGNAKNLRARIEDGKVIEQTAQFLKMWTVNDEEGIRRIINLAPPSPNLHDGRGWFNALRTWTREKSSHGPGVFNKPLYPPDMVVKMRGDENYSTSCGPFSVAYAGLLLSFDVPVRLVHVYASSEKSPLTSHTFTEVWSEDLQKWVAQDVDNNICWINGRGVLMNTREIQDDLFSKTAQASPVIMPVRDMKRPERYTSIDMGLFHRMVIAFQSNYFHAGKTPYLLHQKGSLFHLARQAEKEDNDAAWKDYKEKLSIITLTDSGSLYSPVNQIEIKTEEQDGSYQFTLRNSILNFDHYEMSEKPGKWKTLEGDLYTVKKKKARKDRVIMIRGVSLHGHLTKPVLIRFVAPEEGSGKG